MIHYMLFYLQSHASTSDAPPVTEDDIPVVENDPGASSMPSTSGLYIVLSVVWMLLTVIIAS
jgi:hypothetical protein